VRREAARAAVYWEQEFRQLKPGQTARNRRYYQRQDVIVIRQIRSLLYDQGSPLAGARNKLTGEEARTDVTQSQQIVSRYGELEELMEGCCDAERRGRPKTAYHDLSARQIPSQQRGSFPNKTIVSERGASLVAHLHGRARGPEFKSCGAPTNQTGPFRSHR